MGSEKERNKARGEALNWYAKDLSRLLGPTMKLSLNMVEGHSGGPMGALLDALAAVLEMSKDIQRHINHGSTNGDLWAKEDHINHLRALKIKLRTNVSASVVAYVISSIACAQVDMMEEAKQDG